MFDLPPSQRNGSGVPLHEHTGLLLINGLLQEDLDDQRDILRGALEIDPLLASWAVCTAGSMGIELCGMMTAARWLADYSKDFLPGLGPAAISFDVAQRVAWRQVSVAAVATARLARRIATELAGANPARACWLGMLYGVSHQLHTQLNKGRQVDVRVEQNGRHGAQPPALPWPAWLQADFECVRQVGKRSPTASSIRRASEQLTSGKTAIAELVRAEETELWFRPYPEFRTLIHAVPRKLQRLQQLSEHFEEALQTEKLASLQQLAYGASHEINNPLANISTRAQALLATEQDTERRKKLIAINDQAFRAYEMIADLMLFAKPPALYLEELYLDDLTRMLREELEPLATENGVQLQFAIDDRDEPIMADKVQLAAALQAICVNGIEAMQGDGLLQVRSHWHTRRVEFCIEDTGPGLSESARRHLFDPFFSGREAGRGLGFGLTKAWRIIKLHGGTIQVRSQLRRGSSFHIVLPRVHVTVPRPSPAISELA